MRTAVAHWVAIALALAGAEAALCQNYILKTVAGGNLPVDVPATAILGDIDHGAIGPNGNLYLSLKDYNIVVRVDSAGMVRLVAGNGIAGYSGDGGPASMAELYDPAGLAVDAAGNVFVADYWNHRIRMVSAAGIITTVAGNGTVGSSGDNGSALAAQLDPWSIAVDKTGLYVLDGCTVRKVSNGMITTVAGNGTCGYGGDNGPASSAQLSPGGGIAAGGAGNLYIADLGNSRVRKVSGGMITTVAGNGVGTCSSGDNQPATTTPICPRDVFADASGKLYTVDLGRVIWEVNNGMIYRIAGNGQFGWSGDNILAVGAALDLPSWVSVDSAGDLYSGESQRIRKVSGGVITTLAGNGPHSYTGDNGPATKGLLNRPGGVAVDSAGALYIADTGANRIRKVANGIITTLAGTGEPLDVYTGPASSTPVGSPGGIAASPSGDVFFISGSPFSSGVPIKQVSGGLLTTLPYGLTYPSGIAVDGSGTLYVTEPSIGMALKITNGSVSALAGIGDNGYGGDGGPATLAQLSQPGGIAVGQDGAVYIVDFGNDRIRKIANGAITSVADQSTLGTVHPGPIAVDPAGDLFVGSAAVVAQISGQTVRTVLTSPGAPAWLVPSGIAADSAGDVYVADNNNNEVLALIPAHGSCGYLVYPLAVTVGSSAGNPTLSIQTDAGCNWSPSGLPAWVHVSGSGSGSGSGAVALSVDANSGAARTANISISGVPVSITQQPPPCTYSQAFGGQAFPATGGSATLAVQTQGWCSWTASSPASWISITGGASGTGSGSVAYSVSANAGSARTTTLTIAGQAFTVEEASGIASGLAPIGSMAQAASGGPWTTTITLVNNGSAPAQVRLNFYGNDGSPAALPLIFPQTGSKAVLLATTLDRTIAAGAGLVIQTAASSSQPTQEAWVQALASGSVDAFAVFACDFGSGAQEAVAPLQNGNTSAWDLRFDSTGGYSTGVALVNMAAQQTTVAATVLDRNGATLGTGSVTLLAMGHTSFMLGDKLPQTAGTEGVVQFQAPSGVQLGVLGIRASATGALTSVPPAAKTQ